MRIHQSSYLTNYPNPFNPKTEISYEVPAVKSVKLTVYNILGKEMAELVNERQSPGKYKVSFDASDLTSGVYIYKLSTENFTETKRMILIK
ncbi:MAG: T9SS type A sorting domain-containing protein [Ignavibacteria bacterium]|nr:T9SS type A sorting domain-containing protein [Ignavibacteria bacterium]